MTLQPLPEQDLETVRKALLLRRPDDDEYTHAAHMALAAVARLERIVIGALDDQAEV